ncbi:predicted protein [Nematostella vectensis]|uniref:SET domain-containing protein n=1 Tax=Nematostella vectensis TaxID=45351 RepID=A7RQM7_NEMVE|nr:predicted protein [Nematostella vectensis]|eukprot:XP_001638198.1 predicted protein [Nematostella vectensis]
MASSSSDTEFQDSPGRDQISWEDLYSYLYGHVTLKPLEPLDLKAIRCKRRRDSESSIDGTVPVKSPRSSPPLAAFVFPDEVRLCKSSIPGAKFGVCAAHPIPPGTWIGPFEGQIVTREEVIKRELDTSYMWEWYSLHSKPQWKLFEIYKEGRFSHYIDGKDEHLSSWMRFIQCARYQEEQNMTVFQYCGNIYYRAYKHIPKGRELRVWYDDKYSELIDIPALLKGQKDGGVYWKSPSNGHVRDNELFYHRENRPVSTTICQRIGTMATFTNRYNGHLYQSVQWAPLPIGTMGTFTNQYNGHLYQSVQWAPLPIGTMSTFTNRYNGHLYQSVQWAPLPIGTMGTFTNRYNGHLYQSVQWAPLPIGTMGTFTNRYNGHLYQSVQWPHLP